MSLILLTILGILIFLLGYILFVPIRIDLHLSYDGKLNAQSSLGFFPFHKRLIGKKRSPKAKAVTKPQANKPESGGSQGGLDLSKIDRFDRQILYKMLRELLRLIGRLFRAPDYYLQVRIVGGSEEPDITGQIFGAYMSVRPMLPQAVSIDYRPDFVMGAFNGELKCGLSVRIFNIVKELVVFIFRIPIIKLIKLYRKLKRRKYDKQT